MTVFPPHSAVRSTFSALLLGLAILGQNLNAAMIDASTPQTSISGNVSGAWADGYGEPIQSTFRVNFLVLGNETKSSSPLFFKDVPYTTVLGIRYFAFVYDAQETQANQRVSIDNVTVKVDSHTIWSSAESIVLNGSGGNYTLTPLGNGADFALYIPVSLFDGRGLTGNSTFVFTATQSDSHNGNDEWVFTDAGVVGTVLKFSENDPISSGTSGGGVEESAVPEPGSAVLVLAGSALVFVGKYGARRS